MIYGIPLMLAFGLMGIALFLYKKSVAG